MKFSIVVVTYNRQKLVKKTLESVLSQKYDNFEVLLLDNGSSLPVSSLVDELRNPKIRYWRREENINGCDFVEELIDSISGSHFLLLADDDALVPGALELASTVFSDRNVDMLLVGFVGFRHEDTAQAVDSRLIANFTGCVEEYNGEEMCLHYCNGWGIGPKHHYRAPRMAHSSAIFLSRRLIARTREKQGSLFLKPFGDIGYAGACFNAKTVHYLDLPLAIIGDTPVREMVGALPGRRRKWQKEAVRLEHSPIRGASFVNLGADGHLKVLHRNGLAGKYDCTFRPNFYKRHLAQVLSDSPWDRTTLRDTAECLPHFLKSIARSTLRQASLLLSKSARSDAHGVLPGRKRERDRKQGPPPSRHTESVSFADINDFGEWLADNVVRPKWRP